MWYASCMHVQSPVPPSPYIRAFITPFVVAGAGGAATVVVVVVVVVVVLLLCCCCFEELSLIHELYYSTSVR